MVRYSDAEVNAAFEALERRVKSIRIRWKPLAAASVAIAAGIYVGRRSYAIVPAGHVGVYNLFGNVDPKELHAGLYLKNPFAKVHNMSVQSQRHTIGGQTPSKEGMMVDLAVTTLIRLAPSAAVKMYKEVGLDYAKVILDPVVTSIVREETSQHEAKALYTSERANLADRVHSNLKEQMATFGVIVETTQLQRLELPSQLQNAITAKLAAEQEAQQMDFKIEKERKEALRKVEEANGIAEFQRIVRKGIDKELIKWKAIEATSALANSHNTKVVVIGNGENGLPVILGAEK